MDSINPCCAELKKKFQELKDGRNALRKAVKLLEEQTNKLARENKILKEQKNKLETENQRLSKVYKEELKQRDQDVEAKSKESIRRSELETEIQELKDEISSHQKHERVVGADKEERLLLINQISEKNAEIASLKELLEKEKKKVYVEKRKAEAEKAKASEAWRLLKVEKSRAEEERKRAQNEKSCAEEQRLHLEKVKMEANEFREKWIAEKTKADKLCNEVEAEKKKANREKIRANSEKLKAEELKKLAEGEGKRARDEKARADHFLQKKEEEKQCREEMQKKIQGVLWSKNGSAHACRCGRPCYDGSKVESPSVKLLKEKLKLEKNKVKHYKKITKLQKAELSFVREELCLCKEHFRQILSRLNILDGHISSYIEGTDCLRKDTYVNVERCKVDEKTNFLLPGACGNVPLGKRSEHGAFALNGGSYTRLTSGTDSELDSPLGGSIRRKSQSSVVCSSTSTFTDRKFCGMGKQGVDALMESKLTASAKYSNWKASFLDPNFVTSNKKRRRNSEVLPKDNLGLFCHKNIKDVVDAEPIFNNIRMEMNVEDSRESVEWMCSEGATPFRLKAGGELPGITDCGKLKTAFAELFSEIQLKSDLQVGANVLTGVDDVSFVKPPSSYCFEGMSSADYLKQLELDDQKDEYRYRSAMERPLSPTLPELDFPCIRIDQADDSYLLVEGLRGRYDADSNDPLPAPFIDVVALEVMSNDIRLKASNNHGMQTLHGSVDSSPSSGVILLQEDGVSIPVKSGSLYGEKRCNTGVPDNPRIDELTNYTFKETKTQSTEIDRMPTTQNNVVKCQIGCTMKELNGSENSDAVHNPPAIDLSNLNNTVNAAGLTVKMSYDKTEVFPTIEEAVDPSTKKREIERSVPHFIVHSCNKDDASTSRIIDNMNLFVSMKANNYHEGSMLEDVLHQLASQRDLRSWERTVLFVSCLLRTITAELLSFSDCIASAKFSQFAGSFAANIYRVMSDQKTCQLFQEICGINVLLNLIEEFLVSGKVLMQKDSQDEPQYPCASSCKCSCLRADGNVSERCATLEQFLSGCVVVASFCVATDRIDFLLVLSYKILRWHAKENTSILPMLHVFAAMAGKKFFDQESHKLLSDVVRAIVLIMEGGDNQGTALCFSCGIRSGAGSSFLLSECPFVADALCMEDLAALLVNELKVHVMAQDEQSSLKKSTSEELYLHPQRESPGCSSNKFCCGLNHGSSCAEFSCCSTDDGFCNCLDIVSFLELIGCYMSWEWTYREVILRLLKLLEICLCEVLSTSVFAIIGELLRFGIESDGYDCAGMPELGRTLCAYVDADIGKATISIQLAAIRALLHFLPLRFGEVIEVCAELPLNTNQLAICECIRRWFARLSRDHKTFVVTTIRDIEASS